MADGTLHRDAQYSDRRVVKARVVGRIRASHRRIFSNHHFGLFRACFDVFRYIVLVYLFDLPSSMSSSFGRGHGIDPSTVKTNFVSNRSSHLFPYSDPSLFELSHYCSYKKRCFPLYLKPPELIAYPKSTQTDVCSCQILMTIISSIKRMGCRSLINQQKYNILKLLQIFLVLRVVKPNFLGHRSVLFLALSGAEQLKLIAATI